MSGKLSPFILLTQTKDKEKHLYMLYRNNNSLTYDDWLHLMLLYKFFKLSLYKLQ